MIELVCVMQNLHRFGLKKTRLAYKFFFFNTSLGKLPYSIRVLLEGAVRKCDNFAVKPADVEKILNWEQNCTKGIEVPFNPARVLMQDFTYVFFFNSYCVFIVYKL